MPAATGSAAPGDRTNPRITDLRCLSACAGLRAVAEGGKLALSGRHLGAVTAVSFDGASAAVAVAPASVRPRRITAVVPSGAASGRPSAETSGGERATAPTRLEIADPGEVPPAGRLELTSSRPRPQRAFFDEAGAIHLRYRFAAPERTGVRVELLRKEDGRRVRSWRHAGELPYSLHRQGWNGLERDGDVADDGAYRFRVGGFGRRSAPAGSLKLFGYRFPIRGPHGYGGAEERFGAPRSGGRSHQGQDVFAACGTPIEAARGGRIQAKAYDPGLYGHYVVVDARKTRADHMYVHLASRSPLGRGARVHTGERIGSVGRSGNARAEPCQLHFELWPQGWRHASPADPLGALRRWDGWS